MKKQDYEKILQSIEHAISVCDQASGLMDPTHLEICRELRATKARLLRLTASGGLAPD